MKDLTLDRQRNPAAFKNDRWEESNGEDDEEEGEDIDVDLDDPDIVDRSASLFSFFYT